jgi:hypothetical protein
VKYHFIVAQICCRNLSTIFTPRCSAIEVIRTNQNNLIENCQKKKGDNFIKKCQKFCKNNRNNLINDVNVKFIEYTEDQGKGKSKMESIYLRAQAYKSTKL